MTLTERSSRCTWPCTPSAGAASNQVAELGNVTTPAAKEPGKEGAHHHRPADYRHRHSRRLHGPLCVEVGNERLER